MTINQIAALALAGAASLFLPAASAIAAPLKVTITNNQDAGGLYLTPFLTVLHDGSYDAFDAGAPASIGVETVAETGNTAPEAANAGSNPANLVTTITGSDKTPLPPVLAPGETTTVVLNADPTTNRYLSFLSMVIPTNDSFLGNDNPMAYEVYAADGSFTGLAPIQIFGANIWDAGTEANDNEGAAFSANGGTATDTTGNITLGSDLSAYLGTGTAAGTTLAFLPGASDLIATISVSAVPIPAPIGLALLGFGVLGFIGRRKALA